VEVVEYIQNGKHLTDIYDYWPSFHDGEIKSIQLGTFYKTEGDYDSSYIEFTIHNFHMTSEVVNGYFVLEKHYLITFRFEDLFDLELEHFNHQNAIGSLDFQMLPKNDKGFTPIYVEIDPAYGVGGEFKAYSGKVVKVQPCDKNGRVVK
jgi:hypothetical protein